MMPWQFNDGGRAAAGRTGEASDCVVRAVAIAARLDYEKVYADIGTHAVASERAAKKSRPGRGVYTKRPWFRRYMRSLGFVWTPTMFIGSGCKVHLHANELPTGRLVVEVSRHSVAVIDGVAHDAFDASRGGLRCVYGYWKLEAAP